MGDFIIYLIGSKRTARRLAAKRVSDCFKAVDWRDQRFIVNGVMTVVDGETDFLKASGIKSAMKRLDAVLADLSR